MTCNDNDDDFLILDEIILFFSFSITDFWSTLMLIMMMIIMMKTSLLSCFFFSWKWWENSISMSSYQIMIHVFTKSLPIVIELIKWQSLSFHLANNSIFYLNLAIVTLVFNIKFNFNWPFVCVYGQLFFFWKIRSNILLLLVKVHYIYLIFEFGNANCLERKMKFIYFSITLMNNLFFSWPSSSTFIKITSLIEQQQTYH